TAYKPGGEAVHGVKRFIENCDGLFTSSAELASQYSEFSKRTWVLQNFVDFGIRDWETPVERPESLKNKLVIGWAGSITHQDDYAPLKNVINPILKKYPHTVFCIVSAYSTMDIFLNELNLPADRVVRLEPVGFDEYPKLPAHFDIGLVPVVNTPFNRAKCLSFDTRVSTPYGLIEVGNLKVGQSVWSGAKWVKVEVVDHEPVKVGLRVKTDKGYELCMTKNHRIMTKSGWKRADELEIGQILPLSPTKFGDEIVEVPVPLWATRHSWRSPDFDPCIGSSLPKVFIDETWGELLGFFVGDGNINNTHVRIDCDAQDGDVIVNLIDKWSKVGLPAYAYQKKKAGEYTNGITVVVSSRKLQEFTESLGLSDGKTRTPKVPDVIWRSPKSVVAAFLRGYFEADGGTEETQIKACSKDLELIQGIQKLLLGFDIVSKIISKPLGGSGVYSDRVYHYLYLNRAASDIFFEEIGFVSKRKICKLQEITSRSHSNAYSPISWEDVIVSIDDEKLAPVDIQVEGEVFIAEGFVSHNSDLKPIEYGARHVPYVASKLAPYVRLHQETNGQGGYIADSQEEWIQAISKLVEDEEDRKNKAEFMFEYVKNERSGTVNAWRWAEAFREVKSARANTPNLEQKYV
ncbi:MAG TPA: LAGLIDADG family homing endonuclease, partial [Methylomirabilota bacterium]|nr:LAGLIDADG family homing endonuclease [Methylomirabilota bacterium]